MKWIFLFLLAALLLAGCRHTGVKATNTSPKVREETVTIETTAVTQYTEPETGTQEETNGMEEETETEVPETTVPVIRNFEPSEDAFVRIVDYIPTAGQELFYATEQNFTGARIYEFQDAFLRYGTVKKLQAVSEELAQLGYHLKIWDGFRPVSAQFKLWEVCPDPTYVANPNKGYSSHSRGNTVDLTLVDSSGNELTMPTGFDDFSAMADRDYSDCPAEAAENAMLLQTVMEKHGFSGYFGEWWHFSETVSYPVEEIFEPVIPSWWYADCREFISLRTAPDVSAETITRIPAGETFCKIGEQGEFALVEYQGIQGYVLMSYTQPVQ